MFATFVKQALSGAIAVLLTATMASAKPDWREAFQSSPASYEAPSEEFITFAAEHWHAPAGQLRSDLTPQPIAGTLRYQVTLLAAGSKVRVRLSNETGSAPLKISAVSVGLAAAAFVAKPGTLRPVTFGGRSGMIIPAGSPVISDPVELKVEVGTELLVSAALAAPVMNEGRGGAGFLVAAGDQTLKMTLDQPVPNKGRPLISGVSVLGASAPNVIVAFGDSITDGNRDRPGVLHGWPEQLARRLAMRKGGQAYNVVNGGIGGNRLLVPGWGAAGLARLDRDALRLAGITHIILLEGINDINFSGRSPFGTNPEITADDLIAGYQQVIARAHARGVKVYIGTLTPNPQGEFTTAGKVAIRDAVNRWIRHSGEPDGVIDFEAMVRDPAAPAQFLSEYDSGDHLHPSDLGYKAMGNGIDLSLFP